MPCIGAGSLHRCNTYGRKLRWTCSNMLYNSETHAWHGMCLQICLFNDIKLHNNCPRTTVAFGSRGLFHCSVKHPSRPNHVHARKCQACSSDDNSKQVSEYACSRQNCTCVKCYAAYILPIYIYAYTYMSFVTNKMIVSLKSYKE